MQGLGTDARIPELRASALVDPAGNGMMRKAADCNSKSFEADNDEIHEKELCGLFEAENTLCHLNDRWGED